MRTRVARVLSCMAMLGVLPASNAHALGVRSPVPVVVRARIDVHVLATETAGAWTVTSRSPADASRFMADLTAGNSATGIAYFKAASMWSEADDALGRVRFRAEQGDYLKEFAGSDSTRAALRLFGDERRFFTGDMGVALVDDDQVDDFEHRFGVRADGATGAWRATYWAAALEADDARRINQYATVRFAPTVACAGVSYLHDNPDAGNNHAVVKGEAAGYYRPATVVLSFEASATGSGMAFPSAPWGNFDAGHYSTTAPSNSATFAEVRTRRTRVGQDNLFDAAYQYTSVGTDYTNDLGTLVPGSEINRAWIDWAHRRYALDARLAAQSEVRREFENSTRRTLELTARARLVNNAECLLRAGLRHDETSGNTTNSGFVHGAYTRELREFMGGLHMLVDDIGADARAAAGAELRLNFSATSAVTGRWIVTDRPGGSDALWVRLEFRPTRRTWVTFGYGRENRGDDAYFIEDRDVMPASGTGDVITMTVRGDL